MDCHKSNSKNIHSDNQHLASEKMEKCNARYVGTMDSQLSNAIGTESNRKAQHIRSAAGLCSLAYSSKRPNSTCSASSTGSSSKSGCSRVNSKKSSSEKLCEVDESLTAAHLLDLARSHATAQVSTIPRTGSALSKLEPASGSLTLECKLKSGKATSNGQTFHEGYGYGGSEYAYGHNSLGRKNGPQYPYGSSTIPPPSKDYSTVISNPHASYSGRDRSANSPRLSVSSKGCHNTASDHLSSHSDAPISSPHSLDGQYSWLRRSPSNISSITSLPLPRTTGSLTEAESLESLTSNASSIHANIQHARANSLTHTCLILHQKHMNPSPRLPRSNSIRSTKSEKMYPSMMQRSEDLVAFPCAPMSSSVHNNPRNVSQPTSPTPETMVKLKIFNVYFFQSTLLQSISCTFLTITIVLLAIALNKK